MYKRQRGNTGKRPRALLLSLILPAMAVAVTACTGGSGDSITLTTDSEGVDPTVLEVPVAYVRRPLPDTPPDLRDPLGFSPGARLLIKERSAVSAEEIDITPQLVAIVAEELAVAEDQLAVDIKDLESSFDGKRLVFAARVVPEPVDANLELTTWNLWFLDMVDLRASYVMPSRLTRNENIEAGGGQDIAPHFLPDDRIVFSSTRQVAEQARQLNEGRAQIFSALTENGNDPAAVLHIYDPQQRDAEFRQISFNRSHDLDPTVLSSGEIVFSRWSNTTSNHISLYRIAPSGLGLSPLFGYDSQGSGTEGSAIEYTQPREMDDGRLVSLARNFASSTLGGAIVIVDAENYASASQPVWTGPPGTGGAGSLPELEQPGQEALTETEIRTDGQVSAGGQFGFVYPLRDGTDRLLVTWSECRVIAEAEAADPAQADRYLPCTLDPENPDTAPPLYGAWAYDSRADTQRPVVLAEEGFTISEIIAAEPRDFPDLLPLPTTFNPELALADKGQILIDSVYDIDGVDGSPLGITEHRRPASAAFTARPARFLRLLLPVPIPDDDVFDIPRFAYGVSRGNGFREIAGYIPIEPDGSVVATVPANRPFGFSILDANGRRIGARHSYWLQVGAGEVLHCTGCHDSRSDLSHGRLDSQPPPSNPGAIDLATGGLGFPNTDSDSLFATVPGEPMASTWDFHRPQGNETAAAREPQLAPNYVDEWTAPGLPAEPDITGRDYDSNWEGVPPEYPIVVNKLDPNGPDRIVINYEDHIQPIWERSRNPVADVAGNMIETCIGCHSSQSDSVVPPGQLSLEPVSSDIDPDHMRAYRELLSGDSEQWIDNAGNVSDRQRICTEIDDEGNVLTFTNTVGIGSSMRAGSANSSGRFFACFEGGDCGLGPAPPLPGNCTEDGGIVEPRTRNTVNHSGLLSAAELRLISEWLDIGAQYFNNPFDGRLVE